MDPLALVVAVSIFTAGFTIAVGGMMPSRGEGEALTKAIESITRQPEQANNIIRLFFIGAAVVESVAIYSLVIALIILFANPFIHLFAK
ncbi:ATP synthase F0 subunit C [Hydrogenivirga sp.]